MTGLGSTFRERLLSRWRRARGMGLVVGCLLGTPAQALAEDPGSVDFDLQNEWDAIMRWVPPKGAPAEAAPQGERAAGKSERGKQSGARRGKRSRGASKGKAKAQRGVSSSYQALKESWHEPAAQRELSDTGATLVPALVFHVVGESEPVVLAANGELGGFGPEQVALASTAFRSWEGGPVVNARLLDMIYQATRHFEAPHVHLISGVRRDRGASRHTHGLAADIVLPGVEDEELASYFRAQGFVGVGVYTKAGFVHVDVREKSFFWIDPSPPGKRMKIRPVRADEAKAADEASLARGGGPLVNPPRLSHALAKRTAQRRKQAGKGKAASRKPAAKLASQSGTSHQARGASTP
jgi:hypothetical protein